MYRVLHPSTPIKNLKSLVKTQTFNTGTSGLIPTRNRLKFLKLHSPFCLFIEKKNTQTEWPSSTLESTTLDKIIGSASK